MSAAKTTITSPEDLITGVAYLLGYQPADRMVVVGLNRENKQSMTAAFPLDAAEDLPDYVESMVRGLRNTDSEQAVLISYETSPGQAIDAAAAVANVVASAGLGVMGNWIVRDGSWWPADDPEDRHPLAPGMLASERVLQGAAPAPSRETLAARVECPEWVTTSRTYRQAFVDAARTHVGPTEAFELWAAVFGIGTDTPVTDLPIRTTARAAASLRDKQIRDAILSRITSEFANMTRGTDTWETATHAEPLHGWDDRDTAARERATARLIEACSITPDSHAGPILGTGAAVCWAWGNGVVGGLLAERALRVEPDNRLAGLVLSALEAGVGPTTLREA